MSTSPGSNVPNGPSNTTTDPSAPQGRHVERSPSPPAPPYSPITPVLTSTDLTSNNSQYPFKPPSDLPQQPLPISFSESDNTDALALRSAISILQIQRLQSLRDMKTLEEQKKVAVADPVGFANAVAAGEVTTTRCGALVVGPDPSSQLSESSNGHQAGSTDSDTDSVGKDSTKAKKFGNLPGPQNVVRAPPINWAKYHIIGDPLDAMHEEQRKRPTPGQPHVDEEPAYTPEHVIAAPYNPWTDKLPETSMRTRSVARKEG